MARSYLDELRERGYKIIKTDTVVDPNDTLDDIFGVLYEDGAIEITEDSIFKILGNGYMFVEPAIIVKYVMDRLESDKKALGYEMSLNLVEFLIKEYKLSMIEMGYIQDNFMSFYRPPLIIRFFTFFSLILLLPLLYIPGLIMIAWLVPGLQFKHLFLWPLYFEKIVQWYRRSTALMVY